MHKTPETLHKTPQLLWAGSYTAQQGQDFPSHQHPNWEIVYYRTGRILCAVGDKVYESQSGMLLLTPPHTPHAEYALTAYSNYFITMNASVDHPWPRTCLDDAYHSFEYICSSLNRECSGQANKREDLLPLLVAQLDILLCRTQEQQQLSGAEVLVRQAEHLITERFSQQLTIKDLALELGISPSYLRSQFVRLRGRSPQSYLQSIRLQQALSMLNHSNSNLTTIATHCGYDSASHLSRTIKRATGKSPGAMRPSLNTTPLDSRTTLL
jgi:AraC-like DNA-binding protein